MDGYKHSPVLPAIVVTAALFMLSCGREGPLDPPDLTPPRVSATAPTNGATNVPVDLNGGIIITFNEKMDPTTIDNQTITLEEGQSVIAGSVSYSDADGVPNAFFFPSSSLKPATLYHLDVAVGVRDVSGNPMDDPYVCSFYTGTVAGETPPAVESTVPSQGDAAVVPTTAIGVSFSEPVVPATILFSLSTGSTTVPCGMNYSGTTATFTPISALAFSTLYTATVSAGVRDLAGNPMQNDYVWSFVTGTALDTVPPAVAAVVPAPGATNVNDRPTISITFTEAVNPATITFTLTAGATASPCPITYSGVTATCIPPSPLKKATLYTARIKSGVEDLTGNAMQSDYFWSFKTK